MTESEKKAVVDYIWKFIDDAGKKYRCILECMVDRLNEHGVVCLSSRDVGRIVGMPQSTVQRFMGRLQDEGFFERLGGGVYRICLDE